MSEPNVARGRAKPIAITPLKPYSETKPGLIINVAALVIDAANDNPTAVGENNTLPRA